MADKDYLDLVVCKHDSSDHPFIFRAPACSYLKKGDRVIVETKHGEKMATVERCYTTDKVGEELDFILIASGATVPLRKVLKKVTYKEYEYEDEEDEKV